MEVSATTGALRDVACSTIRWPSCIAGCRMGESGLVAEKALLRGSDTVTPVDISRDGSLRCSKQRKIELGRVMTVVFLGGNLSEILQSAGKIPNAMIEGLLAIVKEGPDCQNEVKKAILSLVAQEKFHWKKLCAEDLQV